MIKYLFTTLIIILSLQQAFTQTVSDVLENSISIEKGNRIFIQYDVTNEILKADAVKKDQAVDFVPLVDSTIFLVRKNAVNVYLRPLNPLNYSFSTETKIILDPINKAADEALSNVLTSLNNLTKPTKTTSEVKDEKGKIIKSAGIEYCSRFDSFKQKIQQIEEKLSKSKKDKIAELFEKLKAISFADEASTLNKFQLVKAGMKVLEDHFDEISGLIEDGQKLVSQYSCDNIDPFIAKYIFNSMLKSLQEKKNEQKKRFTNLQKIYKLVKEVQEKASKGGGTSELNWCIPLPHIECNKDKITLYTISIKESGYKLSDENEIVSNDTKELTKRTIRTRRFQRFIPEVSIGTAFTFLEYNSYGITSDSTGQAIVAPPTKNSLENLNISTMLNFNYYIADSAVHPFYQIGIGINSGLPTIFSGLGLRSNVKGVKRFSISGGVGMTWLKELNDLEVGDIISGTYDIDEDLKYSSAPKLSPYIAIQYNLQ